MLQATLPASLKPIQIESEGENTCHLCWYDVLQAAHLLAGVTACRHQLPYLSIHVCPKTDPIQQKLVAKLAKEDQRYRARELSLANSTLDQLVIPWEP